MSSKKLSELQIPASLKEYSIQVQRYGIDLCGGEITDTLSVMVLALCEIVRKLEHCVEHLEKNQWPA